MTRAWGQGSRTEVTPSPSTTAGARSPRRRSTSSSDSSRPSRA